MVGHRQEFDRELEVIEAKVIEVFAMVGEDLPEATRALLSGDTGVLAVLAERERVMETLYSRIEELVAREILLQSPWRATCACCCPSCGSCPTSTAPTISSSTSPPRPAARSARISRRAAVSSPSGWGARLGHVAPGR